MQYGLGMSPHDVATELGQAEALVLETYGPSLLAFLCACDEDTLVERLEGKGTLSDEAEGVLKDLVPLAQQVATQMASQPGLPRSLALRVLATQVADGSTSVGLHLHLRAGGSSVDLPVTTSDDPVKDAVRVMALDAYPLLLAPMEAYRFSPDVQMHMHPRRQGLQDAVQADPALARLFPEDDPGLGREGFLHNSLGRGFSHQDVMFGEMIIGSAWNIASRYARVPTPHDLIKWVDLGVDTLRAASLGQEAQVPALLVFTGFKTFNGEAIVTPWGPLRALTDWEREFVLPGLEGAVMGAQEDGTPVTVQHAGEMVLETSLPYSIVVAKPPWRDTMDEFPRSRGADLMRHQIEALQLAITLATDRPAGSWVNAKLAWSWIGDPYGHGASVSWSQGQNQPGFMPHELSSAECVAVGEWATRVEQRWRPALDIAVRRLLSAANSRADMADRLVDAVIVWENLFGTSQGEPRLRISAAMAWLMAAEPSAREGLASKLKDIYDFRSKIVHGGQYDESSLGEQANSSLIYARDALRILFRDRTDVLGLGDGAGRSLRLIMGG